MNALTGLDTYGDTWDHTADANTTHLSIRHDRTAEMGWQSRRSRSAHGALARFSRECRAQHILLHHCRPQQPLNRRTTRHQLLSPHVLRAQPRHTRSGTREHHDIMPRCTAKGQDSWWRCWGSAARAKSASLRAMAIAPAAVPIRSHRSLRSRVHCCSAIARILIALGRVHWPAGLASAHACWIQHAMQC